MLSLDKKCNCILSLSVLCSSLSRTSTFFTVLFCFVKLRAESCMINVAWGRVCVQNINFNVHAEWQCEDLFFIFSKTLDIQIFFSVWFKQWSIDIGELVCWRIGARSRTCEWSAMIVDKKYMRVAVCKEIETVEVTESNLHFVSI